MSSSRMIATRNQTVYMTHICSKCGFPLVSIVKITSTAEKSYAFSQEKASQIASYTAEQAIEDEIRRIESCRRFRYVLVGNYGEVRMLSPGYFCSASFSGHITKCPFCGNLEPWKSASTNGKTFDQLSDDNFPIVYKDVNEAANWATKKVVELINAVNIQRQDDELRRRAASSVVLIRQNLEKYLGLSASIPEKAQIKQLRDQLNKLEIRKGQIGLFDRKGKKEVDTAITATKLKIGDVSKTIIIKDAPYLEQIQNNQYNLLCTQAVAFGCTNQIKTLRNGNAFCYQYIANDIPDEFFVETSEDSVGRIAETKTNENVQNLNENQQTVGPLFCRKCGFKLLPDSVFCTKCGSRV